MERKCRKCGAWNGEEEHCLICGTVLDPQKIRQQEIRTEEDRRAEAPKSKIEQLLNRMKDSSNPFVKLSYVLLKTFWLVYLGIVSFILWFIALGPG